MAAKQSKKKAQEQGHKTSFSHEFRLCLRSLKDIFTLKALAVASFDVLFYILLLAISLLAAYVMNYLIKPLQEMNLDIIPASSAADLAGMRTAIIRTLIFISIAYLTTFILIFLSFALSRYLIWTTLLKKRLEKRVFWKFALLNLVWSLIIGAVLAAIIVPYVAAFSLQLTPLISIALIIIALAAFYFTYIIYYVFMDKVLVFSSLKNAFALGARRFRRLWFPSLLMIAVFVIASLISIVSNYLPDIVSQIFVGALLLAAMTWMKLYAVSVLKRHVRL